MTDRYLDRIFLICRHPLVADQVYREACMRNKRHNILAYCTNHVCNVSSRSCTVSLNSLSRDFLHILTMLRLPPTFNDVPTDSDYALDLISQRVASGLHVKPTPSRKPKIAKAQNAEASSNEPIKSSKKEDKPIDWKKWGDRAAIGKAAIARTALGKAALGPGTEDEKRLATGTEVGGRCALYRGSEADMHTQWRRTGTWPPRNPLIPASILLHGAPTPWIETHSKSCAVYQYLFQPSKTTSQRSLHTTLQAQA